MNNYSFTVSKNVTQVSYIQHSSNTVLQHFEYATSAIFYIMAKTLDTANTTYKQQ